MEHFSKERTLVIIKPDGIQRSLVGEFVHRLERVGLKLIGVKMMVADKDHIKQHYLIDPNFREAVGRKAIESYQRKGFTPLTTDPTEAGEKVLAGLVTYMTSGPVIPMAWCGAHAVELVRKLLGSTEPLSSDVGSVRGDFVLDSYRMADTDGRAVRNIAHASGSVEEAEKEIAHWFSEGELVKYKLVQERVLYDVNLDGILE